MSVFTLSESQLKKWRALQISYMNCNNSISWSEPSMMWWLYAYDLHCRKLGSSTTQPFTIQPNSQSSRQGIKCTQVGETMYGLLKLQTSSVLDYFSHCQLNPHNELILEKLLKLQQTTTGYGQQVALIKQCVNEVRIAVHSKRFIIDTHDWDAEGKNNLIAQKVFIKKSIKKHTIVSIVALEINQTELDPRGTSYSTIDLKEVELQRRTGLKRFIRALEGEVFKDKLVGILHSAGFDSHRGLYNKLLLVLVVEEDGFQPELDLQQLNEVWQKANTSQATTEEGACLLSQVCMDISFGLIADGDAIRQEELTRYLDNRHLPETYRRYKGSVFKAMTQIHHGSIMGSNE